MRTTYDRRVRLDVAQEIAALIVLLSGVYLVCSGCSVGTVDVDPIQAAEESYESIVRPLVDRCMPCHGAGRAPDLTSFGTLNAFYLAKPGASSLLVTKGDHEGVMFLSVGDRATVAGWIDSLP